MTTQPVVYPAQIQLTNFRGISAFYGIDPFSWSPSGLSVLVGTAANDVFDALYFMSRLILRSTEDGLEIPDSPEFFGEYSTWHPTKLGLTVGLATWSASITRTRSTPPHYVETVSYTRLDGTRVTLPASEAGLHSRVAAEELDSEALDAVTPLILFILELRVYSAPGTDLDGDFPPAVSRWDIYPQWRTNCPTEFTRLVEEVKRAFPEYHPDFLVAGAHRPHTSPGILGGVGYLLAVIQASPGSTLAFKDFGQGLHPHAIRSILAAFEALADEKDLTILLTTTSPVVLNNVPPEEVYALIPTKKEGSDAEGNAVNPWRITEVYPDGELGMWALGTLYENEMLGTLRYR